MAKRIKKVILYTITIIWMIVIFMFSNQNAVSSQKTSDIVTEQIINTAEVITKQEITPNKKKNIINDTRFFIRKTAHFTLYFILGILVYLLINEYNISKKIIVSIIICLLYSISDEIHQIFSYERTARLLDILIDTLGSITGIILTQFIIGKFAKYNNNAIIGSNLGG